MNLTILTEPQFEPVSLDDVYEFLRIEEPQDGHEQSMLTRHITTARREVERMTRRALVRQKLRLSTESFGELYLLRPPLISVESVEYYDTGRTLRSVSTDDRYTTDDVVPQLRLVDTMSPTLYARRDAVRVTYWAGYPADGSPGTSEAELIANVPSEAKDAILIGVQLLYDDLSPADRETLERARESMLAGLKVYGVT